MNKVFLIGRLVRDPELFETANKTEVAKITLAIQKGYKKRVYKGGRRLKNVDTAGQIFFRSVKK